MKLPSRLTLPSGAVVELSARAEAEPRASDPDAPLFDDVRALFDEGDVELTRKGATVDVGSLPLADFHVLRGVLAKAGLVVEEPVETTCVNCGGVLHVAPCAGLETGPWVDGELEDPELDVTLPFGKPHPIGPVPLGRVRTARTVTFEAITLDRENALLRAIAGGPLELTADVVRAMGVTALGPEKEPAAIARALAACDDEAFAGVADAFLASHYPPRLVCVVFCPKCRARNDIDAPFDRELEPHGGGIARRGEPEGFPSIEDFVDRAHAIGEPLLEGVPGEPVQLLVDEGTPAVDDGGVPLLGAYDPPGSEAMPTPPRITIWYRTFLAAHDDEPDFDWDDELRETIEHELEHHVYFLRGDDPMDDDERAVIRDEARRIVGRREVERRALQGFGQSVPEFFRRTWPVWLLALLALALMLLAQR